MNHSVIEVLFKVHAELRMGEEIRVSGNVPTLGCDIPERAIPLVTSPSDFPWWSSTEGLYLPGEDGAVTYRYCVYSGGKFSRWEGNNQFRRRLDVNRNENVTTVKLTNDMFGTLDQPPISQSIGSSGSALITASQTRSFRARQFAEWGRRSRADQNLNETDGVIIVSYFLPVVVQRSADGIWSATWDNENILSLQTKLRVTWVGSVRYAGGIPPEEEDNLASVLANLNCHPIFFDNKTHFHFYDIFCKQNLWPVLHHVADVYGPLTESDITAQAQQDLWFTYSTVNRAFRDKVVEVYHEGELIWIHGFHLMLLPSFLRRVLQLAKIGMFFHTPFPSSEIWRTMTRREDLLRGILSADQIGFHIYEYARHFLSSCRRLLGLQYDMNTSGRLTIYVDGREVAISCIHIGVDLPRLETALRSDALQSDVLRWKKIFTNKIVVAGIDRLERLKGIPLKLLAIELFLQENPQYAGKIIFAIIGISAGERAEDHRQTQHDVTVLVNRINTTFGQPNSPAIYFEERSERNMNLTQRLAFFAASDVLMVTPPRDGLNRMPLEFTVARARYGSLASGKYGGPEDKKSDQGLVIVSEFISSARVMRGSIVVNPWKIEEVKNALSRVLEMSVEEKRERMRRNLEYSLRLTTETWAIEVLSDLKRIEKSSDYSSYSTIGFGMGFRVMGVRVGFLPLDMTAVQRAYRNSNNRLILLDWGGTLVAEGEKDDKLTFYAVAQGHASRSGPSDALKQILQGLCADPKNIVFVVSGKMVSAVTEGFGEIEGLGLGAEHGFFYRWPREKPVSPVRGQRTNSPRNQWQTMVAVGANDWMESAKMVMDVYVQRTHGTYIEQKGVALIWQFRDADPEFGFLQSKELEENLSHVLAPYGGVDILRGGGVSDGYIEVRPSGISKGLFLEHALSKLKAADIDVDFLLTVGDDVSDEPMFEQVDRRINLSPPEVGGMHAFSVTVGKKPSAAKAYVDDPGAVMELLTMLFRSSQKTFRHTSDGDLSSASSEESSTLSPNNTATGTTEYCQTSIYHQPSHSPRGSVQFTMPPPPPYQSTAINAIAGALANMMLPNASGGLPPPPIQNKSLSFDRLAVQRSASGSLSANRISATNLNSQHSHHSEHTMTEYLDGIEDEEGQDDNGEIFF